MRNNGGALIFIAKLDTGACLLCKYYKTLLNVVASLKCLLFFVLVL